MTSVYIVSAVRTPIGQFQGYVHEKPSQPILTFALGHLPVRLPFSWALTPSSVYPLKVSMPNEPGQPFTAALERVPNVKPGEIDEVYFGNVLSAKCAIPPRFLVKKILY